MMDSPRQTGHRHNPAAAPRFNPLCRGRGATQEPSHATRASPRPPLPGRCGRDRRLPPEAGARPSPSSAGVRTIALFELTKGLLVLVAGFGVLGLLHPGARHAVNELVRHFHFNPARHRPEVFLQLAEGATPAKVRALAAGALAYAVVRFAEAYGLWRGRAWAEWFAVLSGSIYLPLEVWQIVHRVSWLSVSLFTLNLALVGYLGWELARSRAQERSPPDATPRSCAC